MPEVRPEAAGPPPIQLPIWLAALLIQLGSFFLILGFGVIVVSLAYGARSLLVGLTFVAVGYVAVGFPGWYIARFPHHHGRLRWLGTRLRGLVL